MEQLPTWVEIDLDALRKNLRLVRGELSDGVQIQLTVKADAYGHGAARVARTAETLVDRFGVAMLDEALELKAAGIRKPILILSPVLTSEIAGVIDNGFEITVSSPAFAEEVSRHAAGSGKQANVHVEVDTGMGRTGFFAEDAGAVIENVSKLPGIRLSGVFTHFPVADSDATFTNAQVKSFRQFAAGLQGRLSRAPLFHSANSCAIVTHPESHLDMVRPGLMVYGHLTGGLETRLAIEPVMRWRTRIVQVRELPPGTPVSYGGTCRTSRDTRMAVLPVGYGHGYPFRLSNRGEVIVGGRRVPIMGRVTMDMTMVDISDVEPAPRVGDDVVLFGRQGKNIIAVDEVATWAETISYEILCGVGKRVPRIYLEDGKPETDRSR